ncbi:Mitogen-activated protein kinase kinase kinase A [Diplonema papillatum]|nr:Mitogen-activated protein kinase kinase kinase A [Diplonema papillatum]
MSAQRGTAVLLLLLSVSVGRASAESCGEAVARCKNTCCPAQGCDCAVFTARDAQSGLPFRAERYCTYVDCVLAGPADNSSFPSLAECAAQEPDLLVITANLHIVDWRASATQYEMALAEQNSCTRFGCAGSNRHKVHELIIACIRKLDCVKTLGEGACDVACKALQNECRVMYGCAETTQAACMADADYESCTEADRQDICHAILVGSSEPQSSPSVIIVRVEWLVVFVCLVGLAVGTAVVYALQRKRIAAMQVTNVTIQRRGGSDASVFTRDAATSVEGDSLQDQCKPLRLHECRPDGGCSVGKKQARKQGQPGSLEKSGSSRVAQSAGSGGAAVVHASDASQRLETPPSSDDLPHNGRTIGDLTFGFHSDLMEEVTSMPPSQLGSLNNRLQGLGSPQQLQQQEQYLGSKLLKNVEFVGRGAYGEVFKAELDGFPDAVAVKVIDVAKGYEQNRKIASLLSEVTLMKTFAHENITRYLGVDYNTTTLQLHIVMEYIEGGSLASLVKSLPTNLDEINAVNFTFQIVSGLAFLHHHKIVHRDIKGDNVLVRRADGVVKLADFGCSKAIQDICTDTHGCTTMVGTPYWMAPEVIAGNGSGAYGMASDVWSVGCTLSEMLNMGQPPWKAAFNNIWGVVYHIGHAEGLPNNLAAASSMARAFMEYCLVRDPKARPSAEQLLRHPFLAAACSTPLGLFGARKSAKNPLARPHPATASLSTLCGSTVTSMTQLLP